MNEDFRFFEVTAVDSRTPDGGIAVQFRAKDVFSIADVSKIKRPKEINRFDTTPPQPANTSIRFYTSSGLEQVVYVIEEYEEVIRRVGAFQ